MNVLYEIVGAVGARHFIEVNAEQPLNAESLIVVTESGIVIEVKPEQPLNAELPIKVTEFGIVIEVNPEQPLNA